ncbi:hypothetical protein QX233_11145 [Chryseobacterium gambrini]|uniref:Uncharacterized protein n=1 Tax=Chryseobacterium gambrini TaxID=373672 RepID=A0AAJ1R334_9FLAO|nr:MULTISPECIES: hypothetical protein [Chryseobacterium]MDN4013020.1 hypothetical protein [Chryseobacterium gambrini]MDN4030703.1 hypothetical protein [Chryseobacterium gambrini]QWA38690.1 hypothetical protein KKI44_00290 [Chryseobacterium sp. ZHDP1]
MKKSSVFILFFLFQYFFTQQCGCAQNSELKEVISCKPQIFKNNAKIYWQYNCNSSWLTFQNKNIKKKIFSLDKDLIGLTTRLGYSNIKEYKNSFLAEYLVISGCCEPPEYILHNKTNAEIIGKLGSFLYQGKTKDHIPFILTLKSYTSILFTDLNTNKISTYHIKEGLLEKIMVQNNFLTTDDIFEEIQMKNNIILLKYKILNNKTRGFEKKSIKINIQNFYNHSI